MKFQQKQDVEVEVTEDEFLAYEDVRQSGEYNMFDPRARVEAEVDKAVWLAIMQNYDELAKKYL